MDFVAFITPDWVNIPKRPSWKFHASKVIALPTNYNRASWFMMILLSVTIGYSKSIRNQRIAEELSGSIYGVKSIGNDIKLGSMIYKKH